MKNHSPQFLKLVEQSKKRIKEISAVELKKCIENKQPLTVIDVREESEWKTSGHIPNAIHLSKGIIERDIEKTIPDFRAPIVVYCSGGFRCALVADTLQQMGYADVRSLNKGLQDWMDSDYPLDECQN